MEDNTMTIWDKVIGFLKKYAWLFSIGFAILAIVFTFLPVLNYEIREKVYIVGEEKPLKLDYVYNVNLITYFTSGFKLNYTMYITLALLVIGIVFVALGKVKKDFITAGGIIFLLAMCMFILAKEFFRSDENSVMSVANIVNHDTETQTVDASLHDVQLSWGAALGIAFSNIAFACTNLSSERRTTRQIVEEGVLISLAFVLNFIKIPIGPTGGSINFQMLPLMLIALRHGPQHGFVAGGIVYGLLTCLTDGYGFACYPFDYLIGFGSCAAMGFFRKFIFSDDKDTYNASGLSFILLGGILTTFIRYVGSNVSSIVVYKYSLTAALAYNSFYIPISGLVSTIALMLMYGPLIKVNRSHPVERTTEEEA